MDRNRITRTGARTPGEERHRPLEWRCLERTTAPTQSGDQQVGKRRARRKDANHEGATIGCHSWEGPFDKPTLKPYWGKPAVRNFRGDDGNVGIIRSPVRAIALPDLELSSHKKPLGHCPCGPPILALDINFPVDRQACYALARVTILHSRFACVDGEARPLDDFLKLVSRFPLVCVASRLPSDGNRKARF